MAWVLDQASGQYYDTEGDVTQASGWSNSPPPDQIYTPPADNSMPDQPTIPWTLDPSGKSPWSYQGDAALPQNWNDYGLSQDAIDRKNNSWGMIQQGNANATQMQAQNQNVATRNANDKAYQDAQIRNAEHTLAQSLLLAREAAAQQNKQFYDQMAATAEAAQRELDRLKRDDYGRLSGYMYALPGEPALPNVTYQQNYQAPAPLPPSSRFGAPAAQTTPLAGAIAGLGK